MWGTDFLRPVRSHFIRWIALLVVVTTGLASAQAQQAEPFDLSHLPPTAVAAIVASPKQIAALDEFDLLPWEVIRAAGIQELGFDPVDIEQAIIFGGLPDERGVPQWGGILRFSARPELSETLLAGTEPAEIGGVAVFRAHHPAAASFSIVNERTLLVGSESTLEVMIVGDQPAGRLHNLLQDLAGRGHVVAAIDFPPLRPFAQMGLETVPLAEDFQQLAAVPRHLESVQLVLQLVEERQLAVRLNAPDAESAEQLERILRESLAAGKEWILAEMAEDLEDTADPVQEAALRYVARVADDIERRLQPTRRDRAVVARVSIDGAAAPVAVALLLPAVQAAREAARRTQAANDLRQIAIAMHNYHDTHGRLPAAASYDEDGNPLLSWRVHLLPFLEEAELYDQFRLEEPWDSQHNRQLIERMPEIYRNPNLVVDEFKTNYVVLSGEQTVFSGKEGMQFSDILDGLSNTILAVEAGPLNTVIWTKPDDLNFDPQNPLAGLTGLRPGGFQAMFCDGSVRFISENIDLDVLRDLVTPDGGVALP